jgi:4-hydroxybenzoate polyprenyltransferase
VAVYLIQQHYGSDISWIIWIGVAVFLGLLFYQHTLVKYNDLSKVNMAFFTTNGVASLAFGVLAILDFWV